MTKTQSKYWAVKHKEEVLFSGTFTECWNHFAAMCGDTKVKDAISQGYSISRVK